MTTSPPNLSSLLAHDAFLRALARALLQDEHGAEDVVQQTYAAALKHAPAEPRSLRAWLATVTRNFALTHLRERNAERARDQAPRSVNSVPSAPELYERETARKLVVEAVFQLDEPWRTAILLRYLEGMPPRAIAKHCQVPVETVRSRVKRGLQLLRSQLDKSDGGRTTWTLALAPLAAAQTTSLLPEILFMSTKVKIGVAAAAVALTSLLVYSVLTSSTGSPSPKEAPASPLASTTQAEPKKSAPIVAAESAPASSPRTASPANRVATGDSAELGSLEIEVIYAKDNTPAARVGVKAFPFSAGDPELDSFWLTTDDHGRARKRDLMPGKFGILGDRGGNAMMMIEAGKECHLTLTIPIGVDVAGSVVDLKGDPVANAGIWLSARDIYSSGIVVARTDVKGQFALRSVTPGHNLCAFAAGHVPSHQYKIDGVKGDSTSVRLELRGVGGSIRGHVVNADGMPVADATVRVGAEPQRIISKDALIVAKEPPRQVLTGAGGQFSIEGIAMGRVHVQARKKGLAPAEEWVDVASKVTTPVEIRLVQGFTLTGTVLTEAGEPAAGALVRAAPDLHWAEAELMKARTVTDSQGTYRLTGLTPGSVVLDVSSRDLMACAIVILRGSTGEELRQDVKLGDYKKNNGSISGRVVDTNGKPMTGWSVIATLDFRSANPRLVRSGEDGSLPNVFSIPATTDSAGQFTIRECRIDRTYSVSTQAPKDGDAFAEARIESVAANGPDIVLTADTTARKRNAFIRGKFIHADGTPVNNATIHIVDLELHPEFKLTGSDFKFGPIVAGDVQLVVNIPDSQALILRHTLASGETWDFGTVKIAEPGSLLGKLRFQGPRPTNIVRYDYFFTIYNADAPRTSPAPISPVNKLDVQGDLLRVGQLQPGRYILTTSHFVPFEIPFEITSGKETEIEIPVKTGVSCHFQVAALDSSVDLPRAHVKVTDSNNRVITELDLTPGYMQRTLKFSVALPVGTYAVEATAAGGLSAKQSFTIEREDESGTNLELRLR